MDRKEDLLIMLKKLLAVALIAALAGCTGRKPPEPKKTYRPDEVLLNLRLAPDEGTWENPVEEIGWPSPEPWSASTLANAVDREPLDAEVTTLVGEVVDLSVYIQTGAHGKRFKKHMEQSARHNGPLGLLTSDGKCFLLLAEEYAPRTAGETALREILVERLADIIKVTGTAIETGGIRTLYIRGFLKHE